jgi:hypothetical protein
MPANIILMQDDPAFIKGAAAALSLARTRWHVQGTDGGSRHP